MGPLSSDNFRSQFFIVVCVRHFFYYDGPLCTQLFGRITTVVICTSVAFLSSETRTVIADSSIRSVREIRKIHSKEEALKKKARENTAPIEVQQAVERIHRNQYQQRTAPLMEILMRYVHSVRWRRQLVQWLVINYVKSLYLME